MYMLYLIALSYEMVIKDDKQRRVIEQMIIKINTEIITIGEIVDKKEMFYKEHGIVWIDDTVYFEIREIEYVNRDVEDYMTI